MHDAPGHYGHRGPNRFKIGPKLWILCPKYRSMNKRNRPSWQKTSNFAIVLSKHVEFQHVKILSKDVEFQHPKILSEHLEIFKKSIKNKINNNNKVVHKTAPLLYSRSKRSMTEETSMHFLLCTDVKTSRFVDSFTQNIVLLTCCF